MKRICLPLAILILATALGGPAMAADAAKTGKTTGVVTALDGKAGTVTIQHNPIPAVGWPAMTMTFKAMPMTLLEGVKAGDKVAFTVKVRGQDNEVTALKKQ